MGHRLCRRGLSSLTTLLIATILASLSLTLMAVSVNSFNLALRIEHTERARQLAESALALGTAKILYAPDYGTTGGEAALEVLGAEHARGILTFDERAGIAYSTNNLDGDTDVAGYAGSAVPPHCARLVGVGYSGGVTRRVATLLSRPAFPYAVACAGPLRSAGALNITGELDPQTGLPRPAHLVSNSNLPHAIHLGPHTRISGDVRSSGGIVMHERNSEVLGAVIRDGAPVSLPVFDLTTYDPLVTGRSAVQTVTDASVAAPAWSGFNRRAGDLDIAGGLTLDNGVLYVDGDLRVRGGIRGVGALVVTGDATIHGGADVTAQDRLALLCGGALKLQGRGSEQAVFQGLVYAGRSFTAQQVTLKGTLLVQQQAGSNEVSMLNGVNLSYEPEAAQVEITPEASFAPVTVPTGSGAVQLQASRRGGRFYWRRWGSGSSSWSSSQDEAANQIYSWMQTTPSGGQATRDEVFSALGQVPPEELAPVDKPTLRIDPSEFIPASDRIRVVWWGELP